MKCPSCGANAKGKFCEYCGCEMPQRHSTVNITNNYYHAAEQRSRDNVNTARNNKPSGRKTWLWVLGWICIFPVPLTILLLRKKNMKPAIKYGIIAAAWLLFIIIGLTANTENEVPDTNTSIYTETTQEPQSAELDQIQQPAIGKENNVPVPTATEEATSTPEPTAVPTVEPAVDKTAYVLKQGDNNGNVKELQKALISLGYLSGSADGDFGPKTVSAVKAFQNAAGLPATGECDYDTYLSITSPFAPAAPKATSVDDIVEERYVYNKNSKKFHYPSCSSAKEISPSNRGEFKGTREELIKKGYQPCKRCNP